MVSDFPTWRTVLPRLKFKDYAGWMKTFHNAFSFDLSDAAKFRLHVLNHYYQFGWKSACNAFHVGKSTLYDWKGAYEHSGKRLDSLIPAHTRPHQTRTMQTDWRLIDFISSFRKQHGNSDKRKVKVFLDVYAQELGISSLGLSTIGKIIRRKKLFAKIKTRRRLKTLSGVKRVKHAPRVTLPGYIQMDSITVYAIDQRFCFMSVIDIFTKYAWVKRVPALSSLQAVATLEEFRTHFPGRVTTIQTDNGSEFLGSFHEHVATLKIPHEFIYPRSPKINGVVERFNRTIQEEFITHHEELNYDLPEFQTHLNHYLTWYNEKRPHLSLRLLSPLQFMELHFPKSV
jgi:transposase InsO family protein